MTEEEKPHGTGTASPHPVAPDTESQIRTAMKSRVSHFKQQSDSLTFEGVRQLIEKDLGLEMHALDMHKRFIKNCLPEFLDGSDNADASNGTGVTAQNAGSLDKGDTAELPERLEPNKNVKEPSYDNEDKMEDSPVMGLLTVNDIIRSDAKTMKGYGNKEDIAESTIVKAITKRASYFRANAEKVTMAGVRRLLEEDLKLDKCALDPHKAFIGQQLEKVLESAEGSKSKSKAEQKTAGRGTKKNASRKGVDRGGSDSLDIQEEDVKHRKKTADKGRTQKSEGLKKRKTPPSQEAKSSSGKHFKPERAASDSDTDKAGRGHASEDESLSSAEKLKQEKEVSTPAYGKRVERLKSVIKCCGMSVPPSIYKKVKQVPVDKRESYLIKELEEILSREGLSSSPSEKEIKEVKKRKDRARELEGIDTSNIMPSSRRRTTSSYVPPPKPKIPIDSEGEESEDTDDDGGEEDEENDEGNSENAGEDEEESD